MGQEDAEKLVMELRRLAERLKGYGLRSMVLFGSRARMKHLRESDVDVLIVAEGFEGLPFYEREYIVQKLWSQEYPLEPWCYTPRELLEAVEKPRIDVVDALDYGIVVYDDGFWSEVRRRYGHRYKRTPYGGIILE